MSANPPEAAARGASSYKQLAAELEAAQKKIKAMTLAAAAAKKQSDQALLDAVEEAKRTTRAECDLAEAGRVERAAAVQAALDRTRAEEAEAKAKEAEASTARRIAEQVARATALYEGKVSELRTELLLSARAAEEQADQIKSLQEWQKNMSALEAQWGELKKQLDAECAAGKVAAANLARYKTLLQYMTVAKFVKDLKLKRRLLPLHTAISGLVALILRDDDLRNRLVNQQGELARWVHDAHALERAEGVTSSLPVVGLEVAGTATKAAVPSALSGSPSNDVASEAARARKLMLSTNVEYLVASLMEVEHVLHTCVSTVLRHSSHFKSTASGFFERCAGLTAHCMGVELELKGSKARAARTQEQLMNALDLLARLEVKFLQTARKLSKEERILAQKYIQRHGISQMTAPAEDTAVAADSATAAVPPVNPQFEGEDLSMLSPRALHRRLNSTAPPAATTHGRTSSTASRPGTSGGDQPAGCTRPGTSAATARPVAAATPPQSVKPVRRRRINKAGGKKVIDAYESSSSDDEFTLRPVSYTPPPSSAPIRASDWEEGDETVTVGGVPVRIDHAPVPTIAQALSGNFPTAPALKVRKPRKHRAHMDGTEPPKASAEEKQNDSAQPPAESPAQSDDDAAESSAKAVGQEEKEADTSASNAPSTNRRRRTQPQQPVEPTPSSRRSRTLSSGSGTPHSTASWAHKMAEASESRAARSEQARASAHENAAGPFFATPMSGKARMAQPSPYQEPAGFGHARTSSSLSNSNTQTLGAHHADSGHTPAPPPARAPRPPSSLAQRKVHPDSLPLQPRARTRSPSRERSMPAVAGSSARSHSRGADAPSPLLRPSPPLSRPGTSGSSIPKHVLGGGRALLAPLPAPQVAPLSPSHENEVHAQPPPSRPATSAADGRSSKRAAAASASAAPPAKSSPAASPASNRKKPTSSTKARAIRPSTTAASSRAGTASAATPAVAAVPPAAVAASSFSASAGPRRAGPPPPLDTVVSTAAPEAVAPADAYGDDEFDHSDRDEPAAAAAQPAAPTAVSDSEEADYDDNEFGDPPAPTATAAIDAAPVAVDDDMEEYEFD